MLRRLYMIRLMTSDAIVLGVSWLWNKGSCTCRHLNAQVSLESKNEGLGLNDFVSLGPCKVPLYRRNVHEPLIG